MVVDMISGENKIIAWLCEAYLDGKQIEHCIMADTDAGRARCWKYENGKRVVDEDGYPVAEDLYGNVTIELPEKAVDWVKNEYARLKAGGESNWYVDVPKKEPIVPWRDEDE